MIMWQSRMAEQASSKKRKAFSNHQHSSSDSSSSDDDGDESESDAKVDAEIKQVVVKNALTTLQRLSPSFVASEWMKASPSSRTFALQLFEAVGSGMTEAECKQSRMMKRAKTTMSDPTPPPLTVPVPVPRHVIEEAQRPRKASARKRVDKESQALIKSGFIKVGDRVMFGKDKYIGTVTETKQVYAYVTWDPESVARAKAQNGVIYAAPRVKLLTKIVSTTPPPAST